MRRKTPRSEFKVSLELGVWDLELYFGRPRLRSRDPAEPELISRANRAVVLEIDLDHLLALHGGALLVLQSGNDLACRDFDHVASGRISKAAVNAERDPARLIAQRDARELFWRHYGRVENVQPAVVRVRQ